MKAVCLLAEADSCPAHWPVVDRPLAQVPGKEMAERWADGVGGGRRKGQLMGCGLSEVTIVRGTSGAPESVPLVSDNVHQRAGRLPRASYRTFVVFRFASCFSFTGLPSIVTHAVMSSILSFWAPESIFYGAAVSPVH